MSATTIEWTEVTWNPVTGCDPVSAGCDNCYAATIAKRFAGTKAQVTLQPERLDQPLRWRKPRTVFLDSMFDLFHKDVPDSYIVEVFAVMALTPQHTYQVLTKRHGRMRALLRTGEFWYQVGRKARHLGYAYDQAANYLGGGQNIYDTTEWEHRRHLDNVWLGVSVENQEWADTRIPALLDTPASVRFLSCEPLIGPVDLAAWMPHGRARWECQGRHRFYSGAALEICPSCQRVGYWCGSHVGNGRPNGQPIDWVIVGGESGPRSRPMNPDWARAVRDRCVAAGVPYFFKQWGEWAPVGFGFGAFKPPERLVGEPVDERGFRQIMRRVGKKKAGRLLDGREWNEFPTTPGA